ncbi:hypothetical protein [Gordonia polyisoprenivorans]|uniref:hypothetical protein n=1 Tax=Gordonia polyisoprenivorans TaxID=84595 RepID=UPI00037771EF|nr:hypothetical protein [Gordonia polyisoprenivorans]MBE7191017.1 hypothetical protein [Gordonia polyisoprenivorans]OZC32880.1 hypothetical protein CJJ17_16365 [Gordonia polyisoprenivorans]UZF56297.1 hypothetical protein LH935_27160 [Gordonia polyisoprenivorans]
MREPAGTTDLVMITVITVVGVAAAFSALASAYVYLRERPGRDRDIQGRDIQGRDIQGRDTRERLARRWLLAVAVFGVTAVVLRFGWLILG